MTGERRSGGDAAGKADPRPRWGVLGGTFDPPHRGHFVLAQAAADTLRLERVLWVPAHVPPHKDAGGLSPFALRAHMAELAAGGDPRFVVSRIEETIPGNSYTVRMLAHLARALPDVELVFIVGADVLPELRDWFRPERLDRWAGLACGVRPGYRRPDRASLPLSAVTYFESPPVDLSSSRIREMASRGESLAGLVADEVAAFIKEKGLYRVS